jgi:hypothetical protein
MSNPYALPCGMSWQMLTVVSQVFALGLEGVSISAVYRCGIGYDHTLPILLEYGTAPITLLFKLLIPLQFLWALSLGFSKISILLLYKSVFAVPVVIWSARGAIVFIGLWVLGTILAGCLICRPFPMNWDQTIPGGYCGDQVLSFTVTGVLNLLTDVMVLVLPLPYLAKLQMRLYKKLVLLGVFSMGFLYVPLAPIPSDQPTDMELPVPASSAPFESTPLSPWTLTTSPTRSLRPTSFLASSLRWL